MNLIDLITGHDGKLSHSKLWPNVAAAVSTGMFVYQGVTRQLTVDVWLVYLACVGGYSAVIQGIGAWSGRATAKENNA